MTFGLIEAGGTKFVLGVADESGAIVARGRIPTTTPEATLDACISWFREQRGTYRAIGVASFGPLDLDPISPTYGCVRKTPKPHWSGINLVAPFADGFGCPVGIDTDVNGAALAEAQWGVGKGHASLLYLTVGTGVGGGFVSDGRVLRGLSHPEMGHIRMPRHPADAGFGGCCPFHGDCLEGLAAGPSIKARWGRSLSELGADHAGHAIVAWYLGQAMATFQAILEPARIVLGGGVMATPGLVERVREEAVTACGGYFVGNPQQVVVAPGLHGDAGLLGALALAMNCRAPS